ncbi:MAG: hypothetical protein WAP49_05300 [Mycobacterium sp.]|jgi:hypothetical protein
MAPSNLTTIKVTKRLRDRISAGAAERQETVQKFIEGVLEDYERRSRLAAVAAAMTTAPEGALDDWRAEADLWASADSDLDRTR